ncbi:hypothetical protein HAX54_041251 [Datura stramonium]|uniref:Uncharacterized protein n=1 Tax=Datura stramonium TaxID=4076 RepID=A0ABS8VRK7_DATST|nr:hypothetical protein [Datura stramonium]
MGKWENRSNFRKRGNISTRGALAITEEDWRFANVTAADITCSISWKLDRRLTDVSWNVSDIFPDGSLTSIESLCELNKVSDPSAVRRMLPACSRSSAGEPYPCSS